MQKMDLQDSKFLYYATLPSLQEITYFQVALSIWHSYISRSKYDPEKSGSIDQLIAVFGLDINYEKESDKLLRSLNVPRSVKETLGRYLDKVRKEMGLWISRFKYDFFSERMKEFRLDGCLFDSSRCVWMPNGEVDYVRSASKMLSTDELTNEQRFAIMSIFCMEDEIKTISLDSFSKSFIERVTFDFDPDLYYWICYLKQELHKVPLRDYSSIDAIMVRRCRYIQGILYFFDHLGVEDRLPVVRLFPPCSFSFLYMAVFFQKLFSGLSFDQQRQLLSETPHRIIMSLGRFKESCKSAFWVWEHSKDLMTVKQFAEMMRDIFRSGTQVETKVLLVEIWNTALDHHRNYVVQNTSNKSLLQLISIPPESTDVSKFIYKFLSLKGADFRYKLVSENGSTFKHYICAEVGSIENEIINLCVPNFDDQEKLRKQFV